MSVKRPLSGPEAQSFEQRENVRQIRRRFFAQQVFDPATKRVRSQLVSGVANEEQQLEALKREVLESDGEARKQRAAEQELAESTRCITGTEKVADQALKPVNNEKVVDSFDDFSDEPLQNVAEAAGLVLSATNVKGQSYSRNKKD